MRFVGSMTTLCFFALQPLFSSGSILSAQRKCPPKLDEGGPLPLELPPCPLTVGTFKPTDTDKLRITLDPRLVDNREGYNNSRMFIASGGHIGPEARMYTLNCGDMGSSGSWYNVYMPIKNGTKCLEVQLAGGNYCRKDKDVFAEDLYNDTSIAINGRAWKLLDDCQFQECDYGEWRKNEKGDKWEKFNHTGRIAHCYLEY